MRMKTTVPEEPDFRIMQVTNSKNRRGMAAGQAAPVPLFPSFSGALTYMTHPIYSDEWKYRARIFPSSAEEGCCAVTEHVKASAQYPSLSRIHWKRPIYKCISFGKRE